MLKIRALNRESSSDEDFPVIQREAQEEQALEDYNKALRLQSSGKYAEAQKILNTLLNENIPQLENHGGLPSSMSTIKYSCYFNIGNICIKKGAPEEALENYLKASELDATDVTLWHKIGLLALDQNRFRQAAFALSKGLECSESHWPCLDKLISLLYAMKDTISCLTYIGKALGLDPDYTKGLVLRKQIYKDNPATLPYYQKYNPDYIWEPPLDVEIDEEDAKLILEEEQILCDKITEVEKSLGPKPLQTIPLPKALEDFTWISLGKVVTHLHQYLTDNNMTHFTMIDIHKCMSQNLNDVEMIEEPEQIAMPEKIVEEVIQEKIINPEQADDEKMETEAITERRPSQNSETNNDNQENTPNQTDNDEEQIAEQDGEDQDDVADNKADKNRSINKSNKRKRDLLSDLQIWGWHSKRRGSKKGKTDKDFTVEDALNRIIPQKLLKNKIGEEKLNQMEDSMNTMDIYNMYVDDQKELDILSPIHSPKSANFELYFGTDRETDDVSALWNKKREWCDSIVLIRDFVIELSKLWHIRWPKELVPIYIDAYTMYREHYDHLDVFSGDSPFQELRDDALATLLYGELITFSSPDCGSKFIHVSSLGFLQVISGWQEEWKDEFVSLFLRVYWLRCHIFRKEGNNDLAIRALELIQEIIYEEEDKNNKEKFFLSLPNCFKCGVLTKDIATKILKHLDMITSINCLDELFNAEKYNEVANILKLTLTTSSNNHPSGKMGRPAQLAMLMHSLWYTNLPDCFVWTEECLFEALPNFLKPSKDADKWEKLVEKCLAFFHEIIKMETLAVIDSLSEEKRARLVESLTKIVCKQLNSESTAKIPLGCITPWILLHYILVREEHRQQASKKTSHVKSDKKEEDIVEEVADDLPPSVAILFSAHEFLGPKGWCLTNNGELLHFILDTILDRLDTPIFEPLREKIDIHIEQSLFCLYQHPSKKNKISRHLADHNVDPLPLTWERAFQLYDFYGPDCLPEFNSYKNASISSDLEQLLQRIIALVPSDMDPLPHIIKITDYINGKTTELPAPLQFSPKVRAIYYLIGDYYFKQREFNRCIKYFLMDLCINQTRLDSWACIGLSYISQLESKLNFCKKIKSEMEFLDKAKCAQICFKKALEIEKEHIMLWIEFGSFEYMVHSFCSRIMKAESDTLSMEKFEYLENQKNNYLESSGRSFEKAIQLYQPDENEADERWLQYYILGKVAEKKKQEPNEYLQYYVTASKLLHENNCLYPEKINYHNPQHLAVEALELHYRINACILKYLELHEGKPIQNSIGNTFKEHMEKSFFPKTLIFKDLNKSSTLKVEEKLEKPSESELITKDVKSCIDDIINKIVEETKQQQQQQENESVSTVKTKQEDIIMISDSDDEATDKKIGDNNVQEFLDKMMVETMKKTEEQEPDSDTSINSKAVSEVKQVESKTETSETETDIRTSVDDDSSSSASTSSSSSSSSDSDSDEDSSSSSTSSSSENINNDKNSGNMSHSEINNLVEKCIIGLEQCIIRLPQNYKAIYRLAHLYYNYKPKKDLNKCKQLLLGEYTCKGGMVINGLFADRKPQNFFNGIWRIPSSEIDRPGSLSAHMSRCINLLLQILRSTNDNKLLLDLSMQFRRTPDPDKTYIKDSERLQFADQAMQMCIQSLRSQIQAVPNMSETACQKLLQDIFRSYQRVQKHEPSKETAFAAMLTEVYKKMRKDKLSETANILDLATKFCQQTRLVEKQKRQIQNQSSIMRGPNLTTQPPVLPAPSMVAPTPQPPLKRPGLGRPRGRPPLPKVPGQPRNSRGRSPNLTTAPSLSTWQKAMFDPSMTYNYYIKQYQEELLKQYSQSLNLSQLTQLTQYFTQNQLASTLAQQSQYANLLNSANLLKQMAGSNPLLSHNKSSSDVSKSSKKSGSEQLSGLNINTSDAMKNYGNVVSKSTVNSNTSNSSSSSVKKNLPHTFTSTSSKNKNSNSSANMFGMNLNLGSNSSGASSSKAFPNKKDASNVGLGQIAAKQVPTFSPDIFNKANFPSTYSAADFSKMKAPSSTVTKTTSSSSQFFKEPPISKPLSSPSSHNPLEKPTNIIMKDRPNISITPVMQNPMTMITSASFIPPTQTSPVKTLQEKLADKQKQLSAKQFARKMEAEILPAAAAAASSTKKQHIHHIPTLPAGLSVSKATGFNKFPLEQSGISISQVPVKKLPLTKATSSPLAHKTSPVNLAKTSKPPQKRELKQPKNVPVVNLPQNLPISLTRIVKQPEKKPRPPPDDDVILID